MWSSKSDITEAMKVKLLRLYLGESEQRYFDSLSLSSECSVEDILKKMDKLWGSQYNAFTARFKLFHQQQTSTKTVDDFISRLTYIIRDCAFGNI